MVQEFQLRCKIDICNKHFLIKTQRQEKCPIKAIRNSRSGGVHKCIYPCNCTACESLPVKQGRYFLILKNKNKTTISKHSRILCQAACTSTPFVTSLRVLILCLFEEGGKWKFSKWVKLFLSEKYLHLVQTGIQSPFSLVTDSSELFFLDSCEQAIYILLIFNILNSLNKCKLHYVFCF